MKLRKRSSRGGRYYSYEITLPKDLVEALGWYEGMELKIKLFYDKESGIKGFLIYPAKLGNTSKI